jgi:Protein of unknown function (DUF3501)
MTTTSIPSSTPSSTPSSAPVSTRKLRLADIADVRAYERERTEFRAHVIELKKQRRVHLGTIVTFVFENRDTMRFQIQEMARVEQLTTDEAIQTELDIYNPMIPEPGQLCATMFIELTSDDQMREWLPKLAGVERTVAIVLSNGDRIVGVLDEQHAEGLTRPDVTAAVHYLRFELTSAQVEAFAEGDVQLRIEHPSYLEATLFGPATHAQLLTDLR